MLTDSRFWMGVGAWVLAVYGWHWMAARKAAQS